MYIRALIGAQLHNGLQAMEDEMSHLMNLALGVFAFFLLSGLNGCMTCSSKMLCDDGVCNYQVVCDHEEDEATESILQPRDTGDSTIDDTGIEEEFECQDWYLDADNDGYGNPNTVYNDCEDTIPNGNYVDNNDDCQDYDAATYPGAEEIPGNGIDNDCDPDTPS